MNKPHAKSFTPWTKGFTLIELLVVISIIIVLVGIIAPFARKALESGRSAKCKSNLKALFDANLMFAADNGYYVPAAKDIDGANLERWHGKREDTRSPFGGTEGPLAPYLGGSGMIRQCPSFKNYKTRPDAHNAFESSCGGYGYNRSGVGSLMYSMGRTGGANERGTAPDMLEKPALTVMFCDTAFAQPYGSPEYLIEYSFAEPYTFSLDKDGEGGYRTTPSIHFRHSGKVNVAWGDGHISEEEPQLPATNPHSEFDINWLGPDDNSLFDPY